MKFFTIHYSFIVPLHYTLHNLLVYEPREYKKNRTLDPCSWLRQMLTDVQIHPRTPQWLCNEMITKDPTTP